MNITYAVSIALVILCCTGCTDTSTNTVSAGELYPLTVGTYWKFRSISYDSTGDNPVTSGSIWQESVISDTVMNGERWSYIRTAQDSLAYAVPFRNTSEGVKIRPNSTQLLVYKYPAKKNDVFLNGKDTVLVLAVNEPVSTLLATFSCIMYWQLLYQNSQGWIYLRTSVSPGIGKVKMELFVTKDKVTLTKQLEISLFEYTIN